MIELLLEIRRETAKAYLVFDGDAEAWLPKSQVKIHAPDPDAEELVPFDVPEWLAKEKGLI